MIRYHASWILPIAEPPIRDGWIVTDRGRIVAYGAYGAVTRRAASHAESQRGRSRRGGRPSWPRQRAHASRVVLSARRDPAGVRVRDLDPWRDGRAAAAAVPDRSAHPRGHGSGDCGLDGIRHRRSSATSATRWCRLRRLRAARSRRSCSSRCWASTSRDADAARRARLPRNRSARLHRSRSHQPGRACAVLGRAAGVSRDPQGHRSRSVRAVQRASVGIGRGSGVHPHRRRPLAPVAGGGRVLECRVDSRRASARCSFWTTAAFSMHACWPFMACR